MAEPRVKGIHNWTEHSACHWRCNACDDVHRDGFSERETFYPFVWKRTCHMVGRVWTDRSPRPLFWKTLCGSIERFDEVVKPFHFERALTGDYDTKCKRCFPPQKEN